MKKLFTLSLICFSLSAGAQVPMNEIGNSGIASQFAMQAGTIGGVVQSCGQSIVEYNSRVVAAINVLAKTPQEQLQAMMAYQKSLAGAQEAQTRTHSVNCGEAMQSFNKLPLMQPDYKTAVLPQLGKLVELQSAAEGLPEMPNGKPAVGPTAKPPTTLPVTSPTPATPGSQ